VNPKASKNQVSNTPSAGYQGLAKVFRANRSRPRRQDNRRLQAARESTTTATPPRRASSRKLLKRRYEEFLRRLDGAKRPFRRTQKNGGMFGLKAPCRSVNPNTAIPQRPEQSQPNDSEQWLTAVQHRDVVAYLPKHGRELFIGLWPEILPRRSGFCRASHSSLLAASTGPPINAP
jgi:hypothetical protein